MVPRREPSAGRIISYLEMKIVITSNYARILYTFGKNSVDYERIYMLTSQTTNDHIKTTKNGCREFPIFLTSALLKLVTQPTVLPFFDDHWNRHSI